MEFFHVSWKSCNRKESIKARPDIVFPGLTKKIRLMARCPPYRENCFAAFFQGCGGPAAQAGRRRLHLKRQV